MRRYRLVSVLALFLTVLLFLAFRSHSAPPSTQLSVLFLTLTNNPRKNSGPPVIGVAQQGDGLYALFAITNLTTNHHLHFGIDRIEKPADGAWEKHRLTPANLAWRGVWPPGYGCWYAFPWPRELPTNATWRLNLWVKREPPLILDWINRKLDCEVFPPYDRHFTTSSLVLPPLTNTSAQ